MSRFILIHRHFIFIVTTILSAQFFNQKDIFRCFSSGSVHCWSSHTFPIMPTMASSLTTIMDNLSEWDALIWWTKQTKSSETDVTFMIHFHWCEIEHHVKSDSSSNACKAEKLNDALDRLVRYAWTHTYSFESLLGANIWWCNHGTPAQSGASWNKRWR